jgi:hypothetical protein
MNIGNGGFLAGAGWAIGLIALAVVPGPAGAQGTPPPAVEADIVFIYDNSGSMWSHYAKVDSIADDTTFYMDQSCGVPIARPGLPFTYITVGGPRTIELLPATALCRDYAGDPFQARASIISEAIDYLAVRSPNSAAGAVAFAADTGHARPPLSLSVPGNADLVKASLAMDSLPSTNYVPPLRVARTWLTDSSLAPAARKAIIFISDGVPTDGTSFMNWVNTNPDIPIHTIALGKSSPDFASMRLMSETTAGSFSLIDPRDVSRMRTTVRDLMDAITADIPTSLANGRAGHPRAIGADGSDRLAELPWLVRARGHSYDLRGRPAGPAR